MSNWITYQSLLFSKRPALFSTSLSRQRDGSATGEHEEARLIKSRDRYPEGKEGRREGGRKPGEIFDGRGGMMFPFEKETIGPTFGEGGRPIWPQRLASRVQILEEARKVGKSLLTCRLATGINNFEWVGCERQQ